MQKVYLPPYTVLCKILEKNMEIPHAGSAPVSSEIDVKKK
jgi:hypothetical protein